MVTKVGNLKVYCNGKIFLGPDWKSLVVSFLLIFLPSILYLAFIASKLGPDIFWFGFFLVTFNLMMLALTGLSNPGVIPRRPAPTGRNTGPPTRTKDYQINGYTVSTKYCTTCQIYRVPRCSHCAVSDNCVEKFDHYCPWVGTCIGRRNYRFFLLFVFSGTFLCLLVCATSLSRLVEVSGDHDDEFDTALKNEPVAIALVIFTFAAIWFLGGLSVFHTYLVLTNQTTYEHIRRRFGQHGNPYNKGFLMNLFEACCQPNPPYDWENGGSQVHPTNSSSRNLELPQGTVYDPTIIAMQQQAVREQAEKAKRTTTRLGIDLGSCSQAASNDVQTFHGADMHDESGLHEMKYQDSCGSSTTSVDGRQMGMTLQNINRSGLTSPVCSFNVVDQQKQDLEIVQDGDGEGEQEAEKDKMLHISIETLGDLGHNAVDLEQKKHISQTKGPSTSRDMDSENREVVGRSQTHIQPTRAENRTRSGRSGKKSGYSETELKTVRSSTGKKLTNPFAAYADQCGEIDSDQLEISTTLSSLTSNATSSEISTHRTDRYRKNNHAVMSMEEIMSSHRSFSKMRNSRSKHTHTHSHSQQQESVAKTEKSTRRLRFGSDSISKLRGWRTSGENVLNNIRAMIGKPNRTFHDEKMNDVTASADQVVIELEETKSKNDLKPSEDNLSGVSYEDKIEQKTWVPHLPVLTQKKYSELKEIPTTIVSEKKNSKLHDEENISHEWLPTDSTIVSTNNTNTTTTNEIMPDDHPPHKIDMPQLSEEIEDGNFSDDKVSDPEPML